MFWLGGFTGYLLGTIVSILIIYFGFRIGEMNEADSNRREITDIDESVEKEMEQLRAIRDDKG